MGRGRIDIDEEPVGCIKCGEVYVAYAVLENGSMTHVGCGGMCLDMQEAFDKILEQDSYIRELTNDNDYDA